MAVAPEEEAEQGQATSYHTRCTGLGWELRDPAPVVTPLPLEDVVRPGPVVTLGLGHASSKRLGRPKPADWMNQVRGTGLTKSSAMAREKLQAGIQRGLVPYRNVEASGSR